MLRLYMVTNPLASLPLTFTPIMLRFNGVEAAVVINDIELPQYQIEYDDANKTVTCWIPSEAGKVGLGRHTKTLN